MGRVILHLCGLGRKAGKALFQKRHTDAEVFRDGKRVVGFCGGIFIGEAGLFFDRGI